MTLPRPSASRFGGSSPPTACATLPSVFEPSSPYSPASGSSPAPTASRTITHARGTSPTGSSRGCVIFARARRYSTAALSDILGLLLLVVYIAAIVGLAAAITFAVIRIFPTQRNPKKPDEPDDTSSSGRGEESAAGTLFRRSKKAAT